VNNGAGDPRAGGASPKTARNLIGEKTASHVGEDVTRFHAIYPRPTVIRARSVIRENVWTQDVPHDTVVTMSGRGFPTGKRRKWVNFEWPSAGPSRKIFLDILEG